MHWKFQSINEGKVGPWDLIECLAVHLDNSLTMSEGDSFNINLDDGVSGAHFRSKINSIFLLHSAFHPGLDPATLSMQIFIAIH